MKRSELYKSFQLYDFFVNKFSYTSFRLIGGIVEEGELWLVNKDDPHYQVIRISNKSLEAVMNEHEKIDSIVDICRQKFVLKKIRAINREVHLLCRRWKTGLLR